MARLGIYALVVAVSAMVLGTVYHAGTELQRFKQQCVAKGGTPYYNGQFWVCGRD